MATNDIGIPHMACVHSVLCCFHSKVVVTWSCLSQLEQVKSCTTFRHPCPCTKLHTYASEVPLGVVVFHVHCCCGKAKWFCTYAMFDTTLIGTQLQAGDTSLGKAFSVNCKLVACSNHWRWTPFLPRRSKDAGSANHPHQRPLCKHFHFKGKKNMSYSLELLN